MAGCGVADVVLGPEAAVLSGGAGCMVELSSSLASLLASSGRTMAGRMAEESLDHRARGLGRRDWGKGKEGRAGQGEEGMRRTRRNKGSRTWIWIWHLLTSTVEGWYGGPVVNS